MAERFENRHGTFRCPVCGRRERAALDAGEPHTVLLCEHCETPLIVRRRAADSVRFSAQVSEPHTAN